MIGQLSGLNGAMFGAPGMSGGSQMFGGGGMNPLSMLFGGGDNSMFSPEAGEEGLFGGGQQQQQLMQLLQLGMLIGMMMSQMNGGQSPFGGDGQGGMPGMFPGGGGGGACSPFGGGGGGPFGGGGGSPYGGGGGSPYGGGGVNGGNSTPFAPTGSGQQAVDIGRQFLGQNSASLKGRLPNFRAAGGQTNNCADFVSSLLNDSGRLQGHPVGVRDLEQQLRQQGYRQIPQSQAQPGDVWISNSRGHTEMVSQPGGRMLIGSNNDRPGHQVISEKPAGAGVYYHKG